MGEHDAGVGGGLFEEEWEDGLKVVSQLIESVGVAASAIAAAVTAVVVAYDRQGEVVESFDHPVESVHVFAKPMH
jgi:hypothetical protein